MANVKVTVIKKFNSKDVFGEDYKSPKGEIIPECPVFQEGQVLISKDGEKPEGFSLSVGTSGKVGQNLELCMLLVQMEFVLFVSNWSELKNKY